MIRAIGLDVSDAELRHQGKKIMRKLDTDGSQTLDFDEFLFFYQHGEAPPALPDSSASR